MCVRHTTGLKFEKHLSVTECHIFAVYSNFPHCSDRLYLLASDMGAISENIGIKKYRQKNTI